MDMKKILSIGATGSIDRLVLTHAAHSPAEAIEAVDYGIVKALLETVRGQDVRIVPMTSFGGDCPGTAPQPGVGHPRLEAPQRTARAGKRS